MPKFFSSIDILSGKTNTDQIKITSNAFEGYVLTCLDSEGNGVWAKPNETSGSTASGTASFASGIETSATTTGAFATGFATKADAEYATAGGVQTTASGPASSAQGSGTTASGIASVSYGVDTQATNTGSIATGNNTLASGTYATAAGTGTIASETSQFATGKWNRIESDTGAFIVGTGTDNFNRHTLLKAYERKVQIDGTAKMRIIEGFSPILILDSMYVTGATVNSGATLAFSFGNNTNSIGNYTFSLGSNTIASHNNQVVVGQYNLTANTTSAFIVGNGTSNSNRSNLLFAASDKVLIGDSGGVKVGIGTNNPNAVLTVITSGSTTPALSVQGVLNGELLTVYDDSTGSLFTVNNNTTKPILQVYNDNTVLMGEYTAPSLNTTKRLLVSAGTTNIYSVPSSGYTSVFYDYSVSGTSNLRTGSIVAVSDGVSSNYNEMVSTSIGITSGITLDVVYSSTTQSIILRSNVINGDWLVKTIVKAI
jgi:hypothetical protein